MMSEEMKHSAGILIKTKSGNYLMCHCTGKPKGAYHTYDIPKGQIESGEDPKETAVRELKEETGIDWTNDKEHKDALIDLGVHQYIKNVKDLHLFTITVEDDEIDVTKLKCTSFFIAHFGAVEKELPEMNGFILSNDTNFFYVPLMHIIEKLSL